MQVALDKEIQERIFAHVEGTFPNEGGGFLLGIRHGDNIRVTDVVMVENSFDSEEQYHRYAMTPQNWAAMEDEADNRGLVLVGYHHSHPDSPAIPSEYDRAHALPNFLYIITSVMAGKAVNMQAWELDADRSHFNSLELQLIAVE